MVKKIKWVVLLALLVIPVAAYGVFEHESVLEAKIGAPILDVTANAEEALVFILTPKAVMVYSTQEKKVLDRIALEAPYDRIAYLDHDRLVLSDAKASQINIIRYSRVYDIDVSGKAVKGPPDARVHLVIFDDYQCPYCARLQKFLEPILEKFPNDVNCVIKNFPIASHKFSRQAAMAALAAEKQGKFWDFHRRLLENYSQLNEQKLQEIAQSLGLDMTRFDQDRRLPSSRQLIQKDVRDGRKIGVSGTPTVFINGKRIRNRDLGSLPELIRKELHK